MVRDPRGIDAGEALPAKAGTALAGHHEGAAGGEALNDRAAPLVGALLPALGLHECAVLGREQVGAHAGAGVGRLGGLALGAGVLVAVGAGQELDAPGLREVAQHGGAVGSEAPGGVAHPVLPLAARQTRLVGGVQELLEGIQVDFKLQLCVLVAGARERVRVSGSHAGLGSLVEALAAS